MNRWIVAATAVVVQAGLLLLLERLPGAALEPVRRELYATAALMLVGAAIPLAIRPP